MMKNKIYLDYNASTPTSDTVKNVVLNAMDLMGNPSSVHYHGRQAKKAVEDARIQVAALAGARARDVVFTSGGTEANNLALFGCPAQSYLLSPIEHEAVLATEKSLTRQGKTVQHLVLNSDGQIDLQDMEEKLKALPSPCLVSVMMVNNEMGLIQDLKPVIDLVRQHGAFIHSDCVQAAGKTPLDIQGLDLDYMSLSGHKIYGPKGVGALVLKATAPLNAQLFGGGQELGRRSGTENVASIAGFGAAALDAMEHIAHQDKIGELRDSLEHQIKAHANEAVIIGEALSRTQNVTCIAMPGTSGETQVMHMDLMGISLSSGSACSSGKVKTSHVIKALGYDDTIANSSIRISLGIHTTEEDVDQLVKAWCQLYDRKKGQL